MSEISIIDDELGGTYEVSSEVCRAIFILLNALESDMKFPGLRREAEVQRTK